MNGRAPRILIVGVDWLGDVIFSTPLIRALRKAYPGAFIAYSTPRRCARILRHESRLDAVIAYDERPFLLNVISNARFVRRLRKHRFDRALFLHRSWTRAFLTRLAGIPERVGYAYPKRDGLLTRRVSPDSDKKHRIDHYLGTLRAWNIPLDGRATEVSVTDGERERWRELKRQSGLGQRPYAVLHPGGNWDLKRWPLVNFRPVAEHLVRRGMNIAVIGTHRERPLATALKMKCDPGRLVSLCGQTDLGVLAALIEEGAIMISNDSGPAHLAAALKTPLVMIFGPTDPERTGPLPDPLVRVARENVGCEVPCYRQSCRSHRCMKELKPQKVIQAVEELLQKPNTRPQTL